MIAKAEKHEKREEHYHITFKLTQLSKTKSILRGKNPKEQEP